MDKKKFRFQKDQPKINSYVNQVISLENIQFNRFTNLHLDQFKFPKEKAPKKDTIQSNTITSRNKDKFKKKNNDSISEHPLSQTFSNRQYKLSSNHEHWDEIPDSQGGDNQVLKYKIEALESRIKYLREKNYDLKNKVNHQANAETLDFEEDNFEQDRSHYNNQPREIEYLKNLYDHILLQYKQLDKQVNHLSKESQRNKKQISSMKKVISNQNQEIRHLRKKMFKQENQIEQNQEDYLRLLDTLKQRNMEEQNLLQKIKILQQKQDESNKIRSNDRDSNSIKKVKRKLPKKNQSKRRILKVKIENLKNKEPESLQDSIEYTQEEDDVPFLQVLKMKKKNLQILKGRHSLGNQVTKKIMYRKTCQPFVEKDSLQSSYSSEEEIAQFNFQNFLFNFNNFLY